MAVQSLRQPAAPAETPVASVPGEVIARMSPALQVRSQAVRSARPWRFFGRVEQVVGLTLESLGPAAQVGEVCLVERAGQAPLPAEVVGFRGASTVLVPLGHPEGVAPGNTVWAQRRRLEVPVGPELIGRVVDSLGRPIDQGPPLALATRYPLERPAPDPLERPRIVQPLSVGVRAIDALLTCGKGQRVGIFSGSGVGKSTLLGMMARGTGADVVVVGLVGERGREVREFVERDLGPDGLKRAVVVAATSDQPAMVRVKAAFTATAVAEFFRDQGRDVLLLMDSVTRFAMAQREVGLAAGEPPATRGYPPSVFAMLPRLLERAGTAGRGSITGFYTVLVDGDDMNEPIADATRSILDGHIVLARQLAERQHYPAIDVLASVSRLMVEVAAEAHRRSAARVRRLMAAYRDIEELIQIGAYVKGSQPEVDVAIAAMPAIRAFLQQEIFERVGFDDAVRGVTDLAAQYEESA